MPRKGKKRFKISIRKFVNCWANLFLEFLSERILEFCYQERSTLVNRSPSCSPEFFCFVMYGATWQMTLWYLGKTLVNLTLCIVIRYWKLKLLVTVGLRDVKWGLLLHSEACISWSPVQHAAGICHGNMKHRVDKITTCRHTRTVARTCCTATCSIVALIQEYSLHIQKLE